jgi:hypothetical protein
MSPHANLCNSGFGYFIGMMIAGHIDWEDGIAKRMQDRRQYVRSKYKAG